MLFEEGVCWPNSFSFDLMDEDLANGIGCDELLVLVVLAGFKGDARDSWDLDGRMGDGRLFVVIKDD